MILGFSTQLNGKSTYFIERIHKSLKSTYFNDSIGFSPIHVPKGFDFVMFPLLRSKHHTIREDKTDRWQAGIKIDFFINCRQKNMFRFAPVLPVVSVQEIEVKHHLDYVSLFIDKIVYEVEVCETSKKIKSTNPVIEALVQNDGFDTIEDFFAYFDKDFKGKIIHWTDLRY